MKITTKRTILLVGFLLVVALDATSQNIVALFPIAGQYINAVNNMVFAIFEAIIAIGLFSLGRRK